MKREKKPAKEKPERDPAFLDYVYRFSTDAACREHLEQRRWPEGAACPRCNGKKVYKLQGKSTRPGVYKCASCRKPFTVTIGTIFEDSHIPLPKWYATIYLMMASKKGISAHQVHRMLGVTYRSAWFMCHRIRWAFRLRKTRKTMRGTVEADETYVGGKKKRGTWGRGPVGKTPVFGIIQRNKRIVITPVKNVKYATLHKIISKHVPDGTRIITDDFASYDRLAGQYDHHKVKHSKHEWYRKEGHVEYHTNSIESAFALLKRGIHGTFHHISVDKLPLYCDEFAFRFNHRKAKDGVRFDNAFNDVGGRLTWYFKKRPEFPPIAPMGGQPSIG